MVTTATFRIWRGEGDGGALKDYTTSVSEGMVVLDAVHQVQAQQIATSPSAGIPKPRPLRLLIGARRSGYRPPSLLMCMDRVDKVPHQAKPITIRANEVASGPSRTWPATCRGTSEVDEK